MTGAVVDNDILYKGACYGLIGPLLSAIPARERHGILGAARFVVAKKLKKRPPNRGAEAALADLQAALSRLDIVEPSSAELQLASQLEYESQKLGLALDVGESQLCAVLLSRNGGLLATGDKRAITAIETLHRDRVIEAPGLVSKVVCLEQLIARMLRVLDVGDIKAAICAERLVDRALSICFSCGSPEVPSSSWHEGLRSYVEDLHRQAPNVLARVV